MSLNRYCAAALVLIGGGWSHAVAGEQPPAPAGWSGLYAGFNLGYASGHSGTEITYIPKKASVAASVPASNRSSAIGGVQAGYNWQAGHWLLGGEVDFNWLNAKADGFVQPFWINDPAPNNLSVSSRYDWLSTARLRVGYLLTPDWLVYATGGLAVTHVEDATTYSYPVYSSTGSWSEQRTLYGAAISGGFEYAFARNWSVKAEYLHATFNDVLPNWTTPGLVRSSPVKFSHHLDITRLGLNYRWGAPAATAMASAAPQTPAYSRWAGLYAGLHTGYAWGNSGPYMAANNARGQKDDLFPLPNVRPDGGLGGVQLGYNWQMGKLVVGSELDISGDNVKDEGAMSPVWGQTPNGQGIFSTTYDWLATARLRMGVVPTSALLLYMTGGLAVAHVTDTAIDTTSYVDIVPRTYSATSTLFGGTIGAGLEYAVTPRWSVKAEYLYAVFNKTAPQTETSDYHPLAGFDHKLNIARLGINYKFSN